MTSTYADRWGAPVQAADGAAARSGQAGLARALVTERAARKPTAAPSAVLLVLANGGDETWLAW